MKFILSQLPFNETDLEPYISKETINFHYHRHHETYVNNLNKLINGTDFSEKNLIEIIQTSDGKIFNNAAQVWNHDFFWKSIQKSNSGQGYSKSLSTAIDNNFGSFEKFKSIFTETALNFFGSGWIWLIKEEIGGNLSIITTSNANTPVKDGKIPLMTCDLWEHAYYIDYRNSRQNYLDAFWNIVNWKFASDNYN